jgi:capsular polysaccharide biosynthesis protein
VFPDGLPIEVRPFSDQPRRRISGPDSQSVERADLQMVEIPGDRDPDLRPATIAIDETGRSQSLPPRMPPNAGDFFIATLDEGVVAISPSTNRGYLLSSRGELIVDSLASSPNVWRRAERDWESLAGIEQAPGARRHDVILLAGQRNGYWHWWVDVLPQVWLLEVFGPPHTATIPFAVPPLAHQFQRESLELLGLSSRLEELGPGLSQFRSVIFTPGLTAAGSRYPSRRLDDYARWLRAALGRDDGQAESQPGRHLFVSRAGASSRRVVNEDEIAPLLARHGFDVVDCARMSITEQFELFSGAARVVGPHGAGLTNLLFSKPGTKVVEIFASNAAQDVSNYRVLASHLGLGYSRLLAAPVAAERARSPHDLDMRVDPEQLAVVLAAIDS